MTREWSKYQQAVFADVASGQGHTVVEAVPGSGKTTTTIEALRYVPSGSSVWVCAFGREAAETFKGRVPPGTRTSTFNSFGWGVVMNQLGIRKNQLNGEREWSLVDQLAANCGGFSQEWASSLFKAVSLSKATLSNTFEEVDLMLDARAHGIPFKTKDPDDQRAERQRFVEHVLEVLRRCKEDLSEVSYDDQVWLPIVLGLQVPRFDRVLVDETQDLNAMQIELALRACKDGGRIMCVGDRRQAIFAFRGADHNAIDNIIERLGAKVLPLSISYRCPRLVVELAKQVVPEIEAAPSAPDGIVEDRDADDLMAELQPGDFVVSRVNAPLVKLCMRLLGKGRKAQILGRDIGGKLLGWIERADCRTVEELRIHVDSWRKSETKRLLAKRPPQKTDMVDDMADCLLALSEGVRTIGELEAKVDKLFSDHDGKREKIKRPSEVKDRVILASTHKAKGLEADRVWMLEDTYRKRDELEEHNLWYVAVTRAKRELYRVTGSV